MSDFDIFAIIGFMVAFGIVILIGHYVITQTQAGNIICDFAGTGTPDTNCVSSLASGVGVFTTLSYMFLFLYFGLTISSVFLATQVESHPLFFFMTIIVNVLLWVAAPAFSNIYLTMINTDPLNTLQDSHQAEVWFFQNLPALSIAASILIGVILHGKPQGRGTPEGF